MGTIKRVVSGHFLLPGIIFLLFAAIAIVLFLLSGSVFYLVNFLYLGTALSAGILLMTALPRKKRPIVRRAVLIFIGLYLFVFVGLVMGENLQIEGFFFFLFGGIFAGATIHYLIAKIAGPLLFGRGWCGWGCWTAMVLDLLPWRESPGRVPKAGLFRYIVFLFAFISALLVWFIPGMRETVLSPEYAVSAFLVGNAVYYLSGILLAAALRDNRAFCKYLCPITVFLRAGSRFSAIRLTVDMDSCTECGTCERVCPMDIQILEYARSGRRIGSSECILCMTCADSCPKGAISPTFCIEGMVRDHLRER